MDVAELVLDGDEVKVSLDLSRFIDSFQLKDTGSPTSFISVVLSILTKLSVLQLSSMILISSSSDLPVFTIRVLTRDFEQKDVFGDESSFTETLLQADLF